MDIGVEITKAERIRAEISNSQNAGPIQNKF